MITLACVDCLLALRTTGDPTEVDFLVGMRSEWYPDRYPCPRIGCSGKMTLTDVIDGNLLSQLEVHDITPQECFQALNGLGLPRERACHTQAVLTAILNKKVVGAEVQMLANDKRSVLHSITLEDGTRIYLGSSPQGALVYRLATTKTSEVLDG